MKRTLDYGSTILHSYSVIFFSQNKLLGFILLMVSFFNPTAGLAGLLAAFFAMSIATLTGFSKEVTGKGLYSFNAVITAIGLASIYEHNLYLWLIIGLATLSTLILSVTLSAWLGKYGLPVLSIPFILTFWMVSLTGDKLVKITELPGTGFWELAETGFTNHFPVFNTLPGLAISLNFFRSLSAILFQHNALSGFLISIGFLFYSRIGFSLLILGFIIAYGLAIISGEYGESINYYNFGANYMMTAVAIGGFFIIPSRYSYLWAIVGIALASLLVKGLTNFLSFWELPVYSLPFSVVVIVMLYFFMQRVSTRHLSLTPIQNFSPELNLYQFSNNRDRLQSLQYLPLALPFIGEWTVSQGYEGNITHKGDWSKALDFVILDNEMKTYSNPGTTLKDFYCYNKPVLACASGFIEDVVDDIEDNSIGETDTVNNWGNTIIIRHAPGLYTKVSHLKKGSAKVKKGDFVYQGDVLAACGNSGRSPEPHLHFQVQPAPYIGSKTMEYPLGYFLGLGNKLHNGLQSFTIPEEGSTVKNIEVNHLLKKAFTFQPGFRIAFKNEKNGAIEQWEVFTDALNQSYFHLKNSSTTAYFTNDGTVFYFTSFYGDKSSLLYQFYLAAYKVIFCSAEGVKAEDIFPLHLIKSKGWLWLQDLIAPFYQFINFGYEGQIRQADNLITLNSRQDLVRFGTRREIMNAEILIVDGKIQSFHNHHKKTVTKASCITEL